MNIGTKEIIRESRRCGVRSLNADAVLVGASKEGEVSFPPSRRREARMNEQQVCAYSLCESFDHERVIIEQGEVYCINRSKHGILVLMGSRPQNKQFLELQIAETRWEHSLSLYEVQWTKVVPVESQGELFLAGCRLVFGTSRHEAF